MNRVALAMALKRHYRYRISKEFFKKDIVRRATNAQEPGVAVVALFPRGPLLNSATRLIRALIESNYHVIAVVNQSVESPEWIAHLSRLNITLIHRPNIGRDFGAYKIGYLFAIDQGFLDKKKHLVFANDSVYYGPRSEDFVKQLLKEQHPFTAMFVSKEVRIHGQSFFLRFENSIFDKELFKRFWNAFVPSERRNHNIFNGEIALSELLASAGWQAYSYVNAERILKNPNFGTFTENEKHLLRVCYGRGPLWEVSLESEQLKHKMREQFEGRNTTLSQGPLISRVLGAPLKLDLDHQWVTQEALRDTLISLGGSIDEAHEVLEFMLKWSVIKPRR
jgi:hypothetical protein